MSESQRLAVQVAIVGKPSEGLTLIHHRLETQSIFRVRSFVSLDAVQDGFAEKDFHCIIIHVPVLRESDARWIEKLRSRFAQLAIVIVAQRIEPKVRFYLRTVERFRIIDEEYEIEDLNEVLVKLSGNDVGLLRLHTRARRAGWAELVDPDGKVKFKAQFIDFAQMGARLLVHTEEISPKSKWILRYSSSVEVGRVQSLHCFVVWQTNAPRTWEQLLSRPQRVVGLRFIAAA